MSPIAVVFGKNMIAPTTTTAIGTILDPNAKTIQVTLKSSARAFQKMIAPTKTAAVGTQV